jgi:predicted GNAT family N-acyltransferase
MEALGRNSNIRVHKVTTEEELKTIHEIRYEVFVKEQSVDRALEYEYEDESNHFIAIYEGKNAGTARWRYTDKGIKFERFAVLQEFRNKGVGNALLSTLIDDIPAGYEVYLHAQLPAMSLYSGQGFKPVGEIFYEADMAHYKMVFQP